MQSCLGFRQPLIISRQPAKARHRFDRLSVSPGEAPLNDPAARQRHEAAFGFRPFDDLQPDGVGVGVGRRLFPRIALVDERHAILNNSGLNFSVAQSLQEAAQKVTQAIK